MQMKRVFISYFVLTYYIFVFLLNFEKIDLVPYCIIVIFLMSPFFLYQVYNKKYFLTAGIRLNVLGIAIFCIGLLPTYEDYGMGFEIENSYISILMSLIIILLLFFMRK